MAFGSYSVHMETPVGTSLSDAINDIHSWLATRKNEPLDLKSWSAEQTAFLDVRFRSQDEAHLFERDFG